jgi:hypothetical protein
VCSSECAGSCASLQVMWWIQCLLLGTASLVIGIVMLKTWSQSCCVSVTFAQLTLWSQTSGIPIMQCDVRYRWWPFWGLLIQLSFKFRSPAYCAGHLIPVSKG